ncbi:uncharacterized protein LOC132185079 [Corylus avellana]|uniref:uncharacterized protein LOC132185079 n=1 Tax=Corylus avellana TaxID=13451 RepID=UPI00286D33D9|nr:uncharacterized protein LOC132185079 [Corylus avellana]
MVKALKQRSQKMFSLSPSLSLPRAPSLLQRVHRPPEIPSQSLALPPVLTLSVLRRVFRPPEILSLHRSPSRAHPLCPSASSSAPAKLSVCRKVPSTVSLTPATSTATGEAPVSLSLRGSRRLSLSPPPVVTGVSMQSVLIGENLGGCAFVCGSLSFLDKIACGLALYVLQSFQSSSPAVHLTSPIHVYISVTRIGLGLIPPFCSLVGVAVTYTMKLHTPFSKPMMEPLLE